VVLTPDSQQLVLGGPAVRRDWLDWAMFHVEPRYLDDWRDYHRALRQRNRLLKDAAPAGELAGWEEIMGRSGHALDRARQAFLERLDAAFRARAMKLWPELPALRLVSGFGPGETLEAQLGRAYTEDRERGFTGIGPHRADIAFTWKNNGLASVFSRGESKLFVSLLLLAEARVIAEVLGEPPVLLLDEFGAELDTATQDRLLSMLAGSGAQAFLTTAAPERCRPLPGGAAQFHVEHGRCSEMLE
jgi:DNA replication and repair protein RecF